MPDSTINPTDRLSMTTNRILKIFWPDGLAPIQGHSWIIGWTLPGPVVCVITTIPKSGALLNSFLDADFSPKPFVLGLCLPWNASTLEESDLEINPLNDPSAIWFTVSMDPSGRIPSVSAVWKQETLLECRSCMVIYYTRPNDRALQYFSIHTLNLDLGKAMNATFLRSSQPMIGHQRKKHGQKKQSPMSVKSISVPSRDVWTKIVPDAIERPLWSRQSFDDISGVLSRINLCFSTETKITCSDSHSITSKDPTSSKSSSLFSYVSRPLTFCLACVYFACRITIDMLLFLLDLQIPLVSHNAKSLLTCLSQIDLRLQQFLFWPSQYQAWSLSETKLSALAQAQYIGFFNTIWLIANDIILGLALGTFLIDNAPILAAMYHDTFMHWAVHNVDRAVVWLMGWPAGLKLNGELTTFLAELFRWLILNWKEALESIRPHLPFIFQIIGSAGRIFGCTMMFALLSDLIQLWTLPLTFFYTISAKMYHWQVTVIDSLFHLFRGRKRNVLRHRVDMAEYDLDQLLIGTIIFTLMIFLFPTVGVYYILFSLCRVIVVGCKGILEIGMSILNHFPLFALMLRVKDPRRIPKGIRFEQAQPDAHLKTWIRLLQSYRKWMHEMDDDLGIHLKSKRSTSPRRGRTRAAYQSPRQDKADHGRSRVSSRAPSPVCDFYVSPSGSPTRAMPKNTSLNQINHYPHVYMYLQSIPIGMSEIFYQYRYLYTKITDYYVSSNFLFSFLTGKHVSPLPRLDYPTMPKISYQWPRWHPTWQPFSSAIQKG